MTGEPFLRVVRGTPDDAELAALAAVLAGLSAAAGGELEPDRSAWSEPRATLRRPHHHGHGAWRRSGFPG